MKQFNVQRFLNVARWDLTINVQFYSRAAASIIAVICSRIIVTHLFSMFQPYHGPYVDFIGSFAKVIYFLISVISVVAFGYIFHNFLTKQGRISELTLPATTLEKFLWHFVVSFFGVQTIMFIGVVMADFLHVLLGAIQWHIRDFHSITLKVYLSESLLEYVPVFTPLNTALFTVSMWLMNFSANGVFALVNAWKYKHNISLTLVLYFVGTMGLMFLVFLCALCLDIHEEEMEAFIQWLDSLGDTVGAVILLLLTAGFFCLVWGLTYRLYCRAQLTTKRNP